MHWQSDRRNTLDIFEDRGGVIKFYPLLDVTREQREAYIKDHLLPFHPLQSKGYFSIGCKHCTQPGEGREGRWNNSPKTECGLHLWCCTVWYYHGLKMKNPACGPGFSQLTQCHFTDKQTNDNNAGYYRLIPQFRPCGPGHSIRLQEIASHRTMDHCLVDNRRSRRLLLVAFVFLLTPPTFFSLLLASWILPDCWPPQVWTSLRDQYTSDWVR